MAWVNEAAFPIVPQWRLGFSPIIVEGTSNVVYITDWGAGVGRLYRYNISTQGYTALAGPAFDIQNCPPTITLSPNGLRLAIISDRDGGPAYPTGRRIEFYTIATNAWAASSQAPNIAGQQGHITSIVWEDNDTLWAWVRRGVTDTGKCLRYVISTDTWTQFANLFTPGSNWFGTTAAMNATDVFGICRSAIGVEAFAKYNIATDGYTTTVISIDVGQLLMYDRDKLWYYRVTNYRQGYIDTADDSENNDQIEDNPGRSAGYPVSAGINDGLSAIIAHALNATPWIMLSATFAPFAQTDPASGVT